MKHAKDYIKLKNINIIRSKKSFEGAILATSKDDIIKQVWWMYVTVSEILSANIDFEKSLYLQMPVAKHHKGELRR